MRLRGIRVNVITCKRKTTAKHLIMKTVIVSEFIREDIALLYLLWKTHIRFITSVCFSINNIKMPKIQYIHPMFFPFGLKKLK